MFQFHSFAELAQYKDGVFVFFSVLSCGRAWNKASCILAFYRATVQCTLPRYSAQYFWNATCLSGGLVWVLFLALLLIEIFVMRCWVLGWILIALKHLICLSCLKCVFHRVTHVLQHIWGDWEIWWKSIKQRNLWRWLFFMIEKCLRCFCTSFKLFYGWCLCSFWCYYIVWFCSQLPLNLSFYLSNSIWFRSADLIQFSLANL